MGGRVVRDHTTDSDQRKREINPYLDAPGANYSNAKRSQTKTFTIPVCDAVILFGPEVDIIGSAEFQRLAGIKQLGTSYVVYRGAVHTRFEHSLGALYWAEQIIQGTRRNPRESEEFFDNAARRLTRLAALLHDLTHIPFGHTIEDELGLLRRHDENRYRRRALLERSEVGRILKAALGMQEYSQLLAILAAKRDEEIVELEHPFVADIVGNTVNADILDYVQRDLRACGLPVGLGSRFLDFFVVTAADEPMMHCRRMALNLDRRGMPRPDVESEVVKLLTYRYELAERVYFHHAKNAASIMIGRAVQALGLASGIHDARADRERAEAEDRNFHWLTDELLLQVLANPAFAKDLGLSLARRSRSERELARKLGTAVLKRRVHKLAYLAVRDDIADHVSSLCDRYGTPSQRRQLEDEIARGAGLNAGDVLVHLPSPKMMRKAADVRVVTADHGAVVTLNEWDELHSRRISALNEAHDRLWRVAVYVEPDATDTQVLYVQAQAQDIFKAPSRYRAVRSRSRYLEVVFEANAARRKWQAADRKVLEDLAAFSEGGLEEVIAAMSEAIRQYRRTRRKSSSRSGR